MTGRHRIGGPYFDPGEFDDSALATQEFDAFTGDPVSTLPELPNLAEQPERRRPRTARWHRPALVVFAAVAVASAVAGAALVAAQPGRAKPRPAPVISLSPTGPSPPPSREERAVDRPTRPAPARTRHMPPRMHPTPRRTSASPTATPSPRPSSPSPTPSASPNQPTPSPTATDTGDPWPTFGPDRRPWYDRDGDQP